MIAPRTMALGAASVARRGADFAHLADTLHDEATVELHAAVGDVPGKRLSRAAVPGAGRHGISRALNGCDSNPLFRIASLFLVMRRLGMDRSRAQRLVDWLQELVDAIWPEGEPMDPREVLDREQELDALDDPPQQRLAWGDRGAAADMLTAVRQQYAHAPLVIQALRQLVAEEGSRA